MLQSWAFSKNQNLMQQQKQRLFEFNIMTQHDELVDGLTNKESDKPFIIIDGREQQCQCLLVKLFPVLDSSSDPRCVVMAVSSLQE